MTHFADYGLILCPHIETYENKTIDYKKLIHKAVENVITFLYWKEIQPVMFITDQVATLINPQGVTWIQTITDTDLPFAATHCDNFICDREGVIKYPDFYDAVEALTPVRDGVTDEDYFSDMCKRVANLEKALILRHDVIFTIQSPSMEGYHVKPEDGSGKIICSIHNGTFIPTTYIGSMMENPISILDYKMGNQPVYDWRFEP